MKAIEGMNGMTKPAEHIAGPTGCWVHYDIVQNPEDENGNITWTYDGLWFEVGEYEMVQNGNLPQGAEWNAELHSIFRNAVHRRTDDLYNMAYRNKRSSSSADWDTYISALDTWNADVSALATDYSTTVPELPNIP